MPWLVVIAGLVLACAGGASVVHGYPYMQLEFGWTEVIAGSTAISGGIVTVALGAVIFSLASLRRSIERNRPEAPVAKVEAVPPPDTPTESGAAFVEAPAPQLPVAPSEPAVQRSPDAPGVTPAPLSEAESTRAERTRARLAARSSAMAKLDKTPPVSATDKPESPTVAGRYESGGASYVLYSDGTIDVESEAGKRHFSSMDELKAFMAERSPEAAEAQAAT